MTGPECRAPVRSRVAIYAEARTVQRLVEAALAHAEAGPRSDLAAAEAMLAQAAAVLRGGA